MRTPLSSAFCLQGISAPTLQSTLNYALLASVYGFYLLWVRKATSLSKPWWCYALLGLLDVEANFCLVSSWDGYLGINQAESIRSPTFYVGRLASRHSSFVQLICKVCI